VTGATSYSVKYGTASGVYGTPVVVGNLTSYTVTGLTNGTTYYFAVTASNAGGTGPNSNQLSAVPKAASPIAPVLNTATSGNAQVALSWSTVTGATSYSVKYGTATGVYGTPVVVGNLTSYTVPGLTNGTTYYFVVTASNAGGTSSNSNQLSAVPQVASPIAPVLNTATSGNTQVALSWIASTGATSYSIKYGKTSGVYGTPVVVGNLTSYTVTGLTNGTTYYFAVTASNAGGTSPNSNQLSATPQVPAPPAPTLNTATPGDSNVALSWTAVTGATSYTVQYGTVSGVYQAESVGNVTNFTVIGLTNGTTYYFVVAAVNANGTSPNSNVMSSVPTPSAIPLNYTYDDLNRMTNEQRTPTTTSYSYDEVGNIVTEVSGALPHTTIILDSTPPSVPNKLTALAINPNQVNLTWSASTDDAGVFGYIIYRNGFKVATTKLNSFSDLDLVSETLYSYTISSIDAAGNLSGSSTTITLKTP